MARPLGTRLIRARGTEFGTVDEVVGGVHRKERRCRRCLRRMLVEVVSGTAIAGAVVLVFSMGLIIGINELK
jgi:hypothetical protein